MVDLTTYNTVPKLFWYHVENNGKKISIWRKEKGLWESKTWAEYGDYVKDIANALLDAGVQRGDKVSIISLTRYEWVVVDLAIMSIGAVTAPVYPSNTEEQAVVDTTKIPVPTDVVSSPKSVDKPVSEITANSSSNAHASPSVRQFARELGVDLSLVTASGRKNRILQKVLGFLNY